MFGSKVGIHGLPIYFYNRLTGTRWLTCQEFENLGKLDDASLARHLQEIADHSMLRNRLGRPEVDFFAADLRRFGARQFAGVAYEQLPPEQLRAKFEELRAHFRSAVHEAFRTDDCHNNAWCERILATLFLEGNESADRAGPQRPQPGVLPAGRVAAGRALRGGRVPVRLDLRRSGEPPRGRRAAAALRPARQGHHLQSHPRVRRPGTTSTWAACPNRCRWTARKRKAGGAFTWRNSIPAASAPRSSASCACRNGASGSTWTKARTCCNPSRRATTTPTTGWTGGWAAASWA